MNVITKTKAHETIVDFIINDSYVSFNSSYAFIKNNKTYIPIREMSDILGYNITWDNTTKSATLNNFITFTNDSLKCIVNKKEYNLSCKPLIKNNIMFVPARELLDILNISFEWDNKHFSIIINNDNISLSPKKINYIYSYDHIYWLSRIISAESRGEPMEGQIAVGNIILNRVNSPSFPNTIYKVIFDKNYAVQYEPTINGTIYDEPVKTSIIAAKLALNGFNVIENCTYFFNPKTATSTWIKENKTFYKSIGNHDFYY